MNRRTWVMVGALPASLLLAFLAAWVGSTLALVAVAVGTVGLVLGLMVVDSREAVRDTEAFNRLAAEYGGLSKADLRRLQQGLEPVRAGGPATGPAEVPAPSLVPAAALCESCELQPATGTVAVQGRRFRVCDGCTPVPAYRDAGSSPVGVLVLVPVVVGGVAGLAWAVGRVGDLVIPLKIVACMAIALGVVGLALGTIAGIGFGAAGVIYALDRRSQRRALATVTVDAIEPDRAPEWFGQVVAGEVVREVTR